MRNIHTVRIVLIACVVAGLAGLVLVNDVMTRIFLAICIFIVIALGLYIERRYARQEWVRMTAMRDHEMMATLSHYRHDWMNDMQVLLGYVRLNKMDKLAAYLEKIKNRMNTESGMANLGIPSLSLFLLSYRTYCNTFDLQISLDKSMNLGLLPIHTERLTNRVREALEAFRHSARPFGDGDNKLLFHIASSEEKLQLTYHFIGEFDPVLEANLKSQSKSAADEEGYVCEFTIGEQDVLWDMKLVW